MTYIDKGTWTSENAFWVDDETSAFATHFWITNDSTKNFVVNSMPHGSSPDFGFECSTCLDDFSINRGCRARWSSFTRRPSEWASRLNGDCEMKFYFLVS